MFAQLVLNHPHLFRKHLAEQGFSDRFAVTERFLVVDPLPDGGSGDLRRGGIFHQAVNRDAAIARDPCFDVLDSNANIGAHACFSSLALARHQQLFS
ncbi:hypothetical protein D3C72_1790200 [compost metagenome]